MLETAVVTRVGVALAQVEGAGALRRWATIRADVTPLLETKDQTLPQPHAKFGVTVARTHAHSRVTDNPLRGDPGATKGTAGATERRPFRERREEFHKLAKGCSTTLPP